MDTLLPLLLHIRHFYHSNQHIYTHCLLMHKRTREQHRSSRSELLFVPRKKHWSKGFPGCRIESVE